MSTNWLLTLDKLDSQLTDHHHSLWAALVSAHKQKLPLLPSIIIPPDSLIAVLQHNQLDQRIANLLHSLSATNQAEIKQASQEIQPLIQHIRLAEQFIKSLFAYYLKHQSQFQTQAFVLQPQPWQDHSTVLPAAVFVQGESNLAAGIKQIWSSYFAPDTIKHQLVHRHKNRYPAILIQPLINPHVSGQIEQIINQHRLTQLQITACWGDSRFHHSQPAEDIWYLDILDGSVKQHLAHTQNWFASFTDGQWQIQSLPSKLKSKPKLTDQQLKHLYQLWKFWQKTWHQPALLRYQYFEKRPWIQLIEPQLSTKKINLPQSVQPKLLALGQGRTVYPGLASGKLVKFSGQASHLSEMIVLLPKVPPESSWSKLATAKAVVSLPALPAELRHNLSQLQIPTIDQLQLEHPLPGHQVVTVNATQAQLSAGHHPRPGVKLPKLKPASAWKPTSKPHATASKIRIWRNRSDSLIDVQISHGVGQYDPEVIIKQYNVHPAYLYHHDQADELIDLLAQDLHQVSQQVAPNPVIYKLSDLTSDQYLELRYGYEYETQEANPYLGLRGTRRFLEHPHLLEIELKAVRKARNHYKAHNIWLSLPFVRTPSEVVEIKKLMASQNLYRSASLKLFVNLDTPTLALQIQALHETGIDGVNFNLANMATLLYGSQQISWQDQQHAYWSFSGGLLPLIQQSLTQIKQLELEHQITLPAPAPSAVNQLFHTWGVSVYCLPARYVSQLHQQLVQQESGSFSHA